MKSMVIWMINKILSTFQLLQELKNLGRWTDIKAAVQVSQAFVNHHCYSASKLSVLIIRCVQESSQGRGGIWTIGEKIENHLAVPIGKGGDCGQWVRKIWIWPNISLHWCALLCSQGWDIFSWAGWDVGGRNNAVKPTPSRWQNLPGSTGHWTWSHFDPAARFNQSIRWQQASEGNLPGSRGTRLPILILICAKKIWFSLESNASHNYHHHHHWVESHIP